MCCEAYYAHAIIISCMAYRAVDEKIKGLNLGGAFFSITWPLY